MAILNRNRGLSLLVAGFALVAARSGAGCAATNNSTFETGGGGTNGASSSNDGGGGNIGFGGGFGGGSSSGGVPETCDDAVKQQSYIGCEYWPTITPNSSLYEGFEFAIAAANPTGKPATVTVTRGASQVAQVTVEPGQLQTLKLPWVPELLQTDPGDGSAYASVLAKQGAYKVTSSVPITLYQFSPLEFELVPAPFDCPQQGIDPGCFSFTNDASLLLPKTVLRDEYYVMSYPTLHLGFDLGFGQQQWSDIPGFVSITATEDGTSVQVKSTANVRPGSGVGALGPGQQGSYNLNAGDVLVLSTATMPAQETPQPGKPCETDFDTGVIHCPSPPTYDLTGSFIKTNKPVSVIGGHNCSFVPFNRFACDHLEESIFPVEALGQDLIVTAPQAVSGIGGASQPDAMYVRVLSAADNNKIEFDPPVAGALTLNAGQWKEIGPVTKDFRVKASNKILVGQYMVGENFSGTSAGAGDPSESIAIPTEQYRVAYTFLAPASYTYNFVNVVAPTGATIKIDGQPIPGGEFTPIGGSGMSVARHQISGGTHQMDGDQNFGIVVYGYGSYTSYMYPGGLNLETITIVPD